MTAVERRRAVMESYSRWLNEDRTAQVIAFATGNKTA
jgi:hypothetical protein